MTQNKQTDIDFYRNMKTHHKCIVNEFRYKLKKKIVPFYYFLLNKFP